MSNDSIAELRIQITPKNWTDFQHYKQRTPPWIKLHRNILTNHAFARLPLASKALAPLLWLLSSESEDGEIDMTIDEVSFRLHLTTKDIADGLISLIHSGFFVDASGMLADRLQDACRETETETEGEEKTLPPKSPRGNLEEHLVFNEIWSVIPKRPGDSRTAALKAFNARLKQGKDPEEILTGVKAYAKHCEAKRSAEPGWDYQKSAKAFLGPDLLFEADWPVVVKAKYEDWEERWLAGAV